MEIKQDNARAAAENEELFIEKIAEHRRKLYGIAFSYLHNEADTLEALQEASCKAWIKRRSLKDDSALLPWMIRILINCCTDELRRRKRVMPSAKVGEDKSAEMISSHRIDLDHMLNQLHVKYRHVVILKYVHDLTLVEIARILNKPEGTVKSWLHKALKQMREMEKSE
nr:sigma-70 family RNA polymerase sigma factor [Saccharibacillus qingshengii]